MSMHEEAAACAQWIVQDYHNRLPAHLQQDVLYLCDLHTQRVVVDRTQKEAFTDGDAIYLPFGKTREYYLEAIPHELTHNLILETRYEHLNYAVCGIYDRDVFGEEVADRVGKLFARQERK